MQMNLKTTIAAYPKLSESILKDYATTKDLDQVQETFNQTIVDFKQEVADTYVPEVEDRETEAVYARNGKNRKWVELKDSSAAADIEIYFGSNDQMQMDDVTEVKGLAEHAVVEKNSKSYDLEYLQEEEGILWICTTQPIKAIQWMGYLWGDYSKQTDKVVDSLTGKTYYCYHSNEVLLDNLWQFKLMF